MLIAIVVTVGMLFTLTADLRIAESDVTVIAIETECLCGECDDCEWLAAIIEDTEWIEFEMMAHAEYAAEFTALFDSYEFKVAKNGRGMIRTGDSGPYKFVKKG